MLRIAVITAGFFVLFSGNVQAYLDPGTGSYMLQLLIAGLAGAAYAVKVFWKSITGFFSGIFKKSTKGKPK